MAHEILRDYVVRACMRALFYCALRRFYVRVVVACVRSRVVRSMIARRSDATLLQTDNPMLLHALGRTAVGHTLTLTHTRACARTHEHAHTPSFAERARPHPPHRRRTRVGQPKQTSSSRRSKQFIMVVPGHQRTWCHRCRHRHRHLHCCTRGMRGCCCCCHRRRRHCRRRQCRRPVVRRRMDLRCLHLRSCHCCCCCCCCCCFCCCSSSICCCDLRTLRAPQAP